MKEGEEGKIERNKKRKERMRGEMGCAKWRKEGGKEGGKEGEKEG